MYAELEIADKCAENVKQYADQYSRNMQNAVHENSNMATLQYAKYEHNPFPGAEYAD